MEDYVQSLIPPRERKVEQLEAYAKKHRIPIMDVVSMDSLLHILKFIQPDRILEIGTAIGYSAIRMAQTIPNAKVVTIERDKEHYEQALSNVEMLHLSDRINVKYGDAFEVAEMLESEPAFDVLFIDAAKAQYRRFFELFSPFVKRGGVIFSDNVLFRGLVGENENISNRLQAMANKMHDYNKWLFAHEQYDTTIIPVGDGIAISIKK